MNAPFSVFAIATLSALLSSCQGDERIRQISNQQLQEEQDFRTSIVSKTEQDLARRQRFYQGVAGTYEGTAVGKIGKFNIRLRFVPSLPPISTDRVRTQEEVAADLNSLSFSSQIVLWSTETSIGSVGCQVSNIRPDIDNGRIEFAPSECGNYYLIQVGSEVGQNTSQTVNDVRGQSKLISRAIMSGKMQRADTLTGFIQPTSTNEVLQFSAQRIE